MTLHEAKEQWAKEYGWDDWLHFESCSPPDTFMCVVHGIVEKLVKSEREKAIDDCIDEIHEAWSESQSSSQENLVILAEKRMNDLKIKA